MNKENKPIQNLFVYGTLLSKYNNEMSVFLRSNSKFIGNGFIYGKLYDLGKYPAAVDLDTDSKVFGEIYQLINFDETIKILDDYEEIGEEFSLPNEYIRKEVNVFINNKKLSCYCYIYNLLI